MDQFVEADHIKQGFPVPTQYFQPMEKFPSESSNQQPPPQYGPQLQYHQNVPSHQSQQNFQNFQNIQNIQNIHTGFNMALGHPPNAQLPPPPHLQNSPPQPQYFPSFPAQVPFSGNVDDPRCVPHDAISLVRDLQNNRMRGLQTYPSGFISHLKAELPRVSHLGESGSPSKKEDHGLVLLIPPLHVQQKNASKEDTENHHHAITTKCLRCKKDFVQSFVRDKPDAKVFKLCHRCRDMQRQRSRRWQKKTKEQQGSCRRCGGVIPSDQLRFVLCSQCRESLRLRKANRAAQGKCVHCLGPIESLIMGDQAGEPRPRSGLFKVCQRCRENDKIRRTNLERMGNCNRCARALEPSQQGKHKVCLVCRQKKKKRALLMSLEPDSSMGMELPVFQHNAPVQLERSQQSVPQLGQPQGPVGIGFPMAGGQQMGQSMGSMGLGQDYYQYSQPGQQLPQPMSMPQYLNQQGFSRGRIQ